MSDESTTWRRVISQAMEGQDTWADVVHCTLKDEALDVEFNSGFGGTEGAPFLLWTKDHVYFPMCYDGAEWCESAPRNPCDEPMGHFGG